MKYLKFKNLIAILVIIATLTSCSKDEPTGMSMDGYQETVISNNIEDLYTSMGDESSDTVWVYLQGGPVKEHEGFDLEESEYTWFADDLRVYPRQTQTINKTIAEESDFTFDNAKKENENTAKIVNDVVTHFKNQDKVVYIIGHSYGAFVAQEVLRLYGPIAAHTMILNGRIDMDTDVWTGFSKGESWEFDENGLNPTFDTDNAGKIEEQNMNKMAAGAGHRRYTEDLANIDLSTVSFISAEFDQAVGRYSDAELTFAEQNAAFGVILPGFGHSDVFDPEILKALHDRMVKNNVVMEGFYANGIKILTDKTPVEIIKSSYTIDGGASQTLSTFELGSLDGFDHPFFVLAEGNTMFFVGINDEFEISGDVLLYTKDGGQTFYNTESFSSEQSAIGYSLSGSFSNSQGDTKNFTLELSENQAGEGASEITVTGSLAVINGELGSKTYNQILDLNANYPAVTVILLGSIDGSVNDDVNVLTGRLIREAGYTTAVNAESRIYSGGVDLYCSGKNRIWEEGSEIGVHSWCCYEGMTADELPVDSPGHDKQIAYFTEMLGEVNGPAFYYFTINAAPFDSIHVMTKAELDQYSLITQ